ncbi:hypothetical protein HKX48_009005 [Thoreauomyces humboldtii]|nr:hypothetical protein HKX48_009005 [Thoreauomyces humboldtii]
MAVAESQGHDIADDLTLAYVELVSSQPAGNVCAVYEGMDSEVAYVSYPLAQGWLTLREELAKISKGTTGLVTWEAALRFGEFLLDGRLDVSGKRVLELGAGTGFLGLLAARQGAESVMLTDVDQGVLARLRENVAINDSGQPHGFGSSVTVCRLDWNHLDLPLLAACDLVMCADVVYDPSLISPLVATLAAFLNGEKLKEAWVALTVRREGTLDMFLEALRLAGIVFDRIHIGKVGAVPELFCHEEGCGDVVLIKMSMRTCHQIL